MQFELIETGSEVRLRTPEIELGWSRETGAPVVLARRDGPNALGHGPTRPGIDVALGAVDGWTAARSFARYLAHRAEPAADAVAVVVNIGLGPLKIRDRYLVRGDVVEREVTVENVGLDDLRLYGVRLCVPNARVGNASGCRVEAPGNSVRPQVPLAVAAAQRRDVLPRRFFAPGVRGSGAIEPAPTQGPGLLALHGAPPEQTLLCWYDGAAAAALPFVEGADGWLNAVSLVHEVGLAVYLRPGEQVAVGPQHLVLAGQPWAQARQRAAPGPAPGVATWVANTPIYLCHPAAHGGLAGLAAAVPRLAALGVGALALRPVHLTAGGHILDLEQVDPALGGEAALRELMAAARAAGLRVLLDLELRGCAAESRYLAEHPDWFARDEGGAFVVGPPAAVPAVSAHPGVALAPGCYSFDWNNEDLQAYLMAWALAQADALGLDGFRAVAPYSPPLAWSRRHPQHPGDGALAPLAWLRGLRARLARRSPDLALLTTLSGPAFGALCDGLYDYPVHLMFVHAALRRATGHELGAYLDDLRAATPPGVARISFMESHDTCELNPLADGLRGSRISRMLQAAMVLCGFVPSLWSGQEEGEEPFLKALLNLWRSEPALRQGAADFKTARCPSLDVLAVIREHKGRRLLGLMHTGPCLITARVALPAGLAPRKPRDMLAMAPLVAEREQGGLRLSLAPFSTYCIELSG